MNDLSQNLHAPRVLCAISGGVDSAVAAALLLKAGYEVTGAFIKCYTDFADKNADYADNQRSCWIDERRDAMRVAAKLGVKLLTFDFEKEYRQFVVDYLFREYKAGRTPNPDVICNQRVKIPLLLREATRLGFDYVATGHYARIVTRTLEHLNTGTLEHENTRTLEHGNTGTLESHTSSPCFAGQATGYRLQATGYRLQVTGYRLLMAADKNKDQSYFLHQLKQMHLRRLLFPLGNLNKDEVRQLARKMRLPVADKEESMGICFIGERKMGEFLGQRLKDRPGDIISVHGKKLGRHRGLFFYTIGQRQGLGLGGGLSQLASGQAGLPYFVVGKDLKRNRLIVVQGENHPALFRQDCLVSQVNWIAGQPPKFPLKCEVRLRHRQPLQECRIFLVIPRFKRGIQKNRQNRGFKVVFDKPQRAVTPGQFAVFYLNRECLGGGEIG